MLGQVAAGPSGYVEVQNPNDFAVDISGYRLTGALAFTFAPGMRARTGFMDMPATGPGAPQNAALPCL